MSSPPPPTLWTSGPESTLPLIAVRTKLCPKNSRPHPPPLLAVPGVFSINARYELFHEVLGVKHGTAPAFWESHALSVKGGFARVGFLSMKSFNSKGVSAPTWGPERGSVGSAKA